LETGGVRLFPFLARLRIIFGSGGADRAGLLSGDIEELNPHIASTVAPLSRIREKEIGDVGGQAQRGASGSVCSGHRRGRVGLARASHKST